MTDHVRDELCGVFAPMVTPFKDDELFIDGLIANVEQMNCSGLRGYFVLGTNGEYKSLNFEEQTRVLTAVVKHRSSDKVVMAGCGAESTKATIDAVNRAVDCGADLVTLLMPHFFAKRITPEIMVSYIIEVADLSAVPVLLYNNPSVAAGVGIGPEVIKEVKGHPNVIGIKDSSRQSWRSNLEAAAGDDFSVLAGSANYFFDLLEVGGRGGVLSLANVFPGRCANLYRVFMDGKREEAGKLNEELVSLNRSVSGSYGVAGVKAAMDLVGFSGGLPRKPLPGLSGPELQSLEEAVRAAGFL